MAKPQDIVSVTGPNSLDHDSLLLGAKAPDWFDGWNASADAIIAELQTGNTPFTNIAALAYKVIVFYARGNHPKGVVWSSPQEVLGLLQNRFEAAATEDTLPDVRAFMDGFGPLVEEFCIEQPTSQIVWSSDDTAAQLSHGFGMRHEPCKTLKVDVGDRGEESAWEMFVDASITRKALQEASFRPETINLLCAPVINEQPQTPPFNFL